MSYACRICNHPQREQIEKDLREMRRIGLVQAKWGLSWQSCSNHKQKHIQSTIDPWQQLLDEVQSAYEVAKQDKDHKAVAALLNRKGEILKIVNMNSGKTPGNHQSLSIEELDGLVDHYTKKRENVLA